MNIFDLTISDTATVDLLHPATDKPLLLEDGQKMHVVVCGTDSKQYAELQHQKNTKLLEMVPDAGEGYKPTDEDIANLEALNNELLRECVISILYEGPDGESTDIDAFFDNAPKLMIAQVKTAIESRANFMAA